jgi:leader peptidase (prepilin peptidase)/N-methyltransferase
VIGALVGGGVLWLIAEGYFRFTGQEGMGGGDIKMLAMVGAFLGWQAVLLTLVLASLVGALIGVLIMATRRGGMKFAVPFGTFLAVGALTASLVGARLITWYMSFYELP